MVGFIALIEFFKDVLLRFPVHADARIAHLHGSGIIHSNQADADCAALGSKLDGVVDQIDPSLGEHLGVAVAGDLLQVDHQLQMLLLPLLLQQQNAGAQLLIQTEGRFFGHNLLIFQLAQQQNVGSQVGQARGLIGDDGGVLAALLIGNIIPL